MRASLCKSSAAFRWLGPSDNGADSGPELRAWENVKRGMCGGNAVYPDDTPESALCPHSSLTMTQALCIYINSVILYCLITSIFLYLSLGSDTSTHQNTVQLCKILLHIQVLFGFACWTLLFLCFMNLYHFIYVELDDLIESALKYPDCDLLPHSCLLFQRRIKFSAKVII